MNTAQSWLDRTDPRAKALAEGTPDEAERKLAGATLMQEANRRLYQRMCVQDGIEMSAGEGEI